MLFISPGWNRKAFCVFPGSLCSWPDCRFPVGAVEKCVVQARGAHGAERASSSRQSSPRRAAGWQRFRLLECLELWTWAVCSRGLACKCNKEYSLVGVWLSVLWLLSFTALLVEEVGCLFGVGCQCWATVDVALGFVNPCMKQLFWDFRFLETHHGRRCVYELVEEIRCSLSREDLRYLPWGSCF